jgi:tetratricopeptide (TPR) repeat protein
MFYCASVSRRYRCALLEFVLVLFLVLSVSQREDIATRHWEAAKKLSKENDLEGSIREVTKCIEYLPNVSNFYASRALLLERSNRPSEALADAKRALWLEPDNSVAAETAYYSAIQLGDLTQATQILERHTSQIKNSEQKSLVCRLRLLWDKGDTEEWLRVSKELDKYPELAASQLSRASLLQDRGRWRESLECLEKAVTNSESREMCEALTQRAWTLATCPIDSVRDGNRAISDGLKVEALRPESNTQNLEALAAGYAVTGDYKNAAKYQQSAIDLMKKFFADPDTIYGEGFSKDLMLRDLTTRLELYQAEKPYLQPLKSDRSRFGVPKDVPAIPSVPRYVSTLSDSGDIVETFTKSDE